MPLIAGIRSLLSPSKFLSKAGNRRRNGGGNALYLEALEGRELFTVDPVLTTFTVSVGHAATKTFTTAQFADSTHDTLTSVTIETLPGHGTLTLGNVTVTAGQTLTAASLATLIYTPTTTYSGADSFTWNAADGTHTFGNASVNINVLETAPVLSAVPLTTSHANPITFALAQFSAHFTDAESDALNSITIVSLPTHGQLLLSGTPIVVNTAITAANIGSLTYIPTTSYNGPDSFLWNATDGVLPAAVNAAVNLQVVETAPTVKPFFSVAGQNESVSFLNGTSNLFSLSFTDVDTGDSLQQVKFISLPTHGNLTLTTGNTTTAITLNQVVAAADIGNITYTPATGYIGTDTFKWTASDGLIFATTPSLATLDVRYFEIVANNNVLSKGDMAPTAAKFTDFGFSSTTIGSPSVTRTYTITDVGSLPLDFTGSPMIKISGANAADFTVTQPSGNLTTGQSTTFTITFTPHGTGTRNATVTILNDVPTQSPFTFAIRGSGLTTGTTVDGLMLAQTQGGGGKGATSLDTLSVNYTGTLLNGTVFDSSLQPGRTPLSFTLGEGQVIAGWDEGLVGIKKGETRVLIIPAALAYGATGNVSAGIPANSTLIFTVTAVSDSKPKLAVFGNNVPILVTDDTPSLLDGTSFGTLPAGNTTLAHTFQIIDEGGGVLGFPSDPTNHPAVTITGPDAANFFASTVNFSSGSTSASFTVTYQPQSAGVKNAVVHVHTNDPLVPDFVFAITGSMFFTDLTTTLGPVVLPTAPTVVGASTTLTVPVLVKNIGGLAVPASTPNAKLTILIHDNVNNVDLPLQTYTGLSVSGLGLNQTKTFSEKIMIPSGFDVDNATITASLLADATHPIVETDPLAPSTVTTNNTLTATLSANLMPKLVSTTLLPQVQAGVKQSGSVSISLQNVGTVALSSSQKVNIVVTAVETGGAIIPLGTLTNQSIGSLAGGASKGFTVNIPSGTIFAAGAYTIHAVITLVPAIPGELASDNDSSLVAGSAALTVTASAPFDNITGTLVGSTLATAAGNTAPITGNVSVSVLNAANRALPSGEKVVIEIVAHNTDETKTDIVLATSTAQSISAWAANKSQTFTVPVNFTDGLLIDHYQIEALLIPQGPVITESSLADNLITTKTGNVAITYNSQAPTNDFVVNTVTSSIGSHAAHIALTGNVSVRVQNAGNIPLPNPQHITIQIYAQPSSAASTDHTGDTLLQISAPFSIASLATGGALTFTVPVNFATGLATGSYNIIALIAPVSGEPLTTPVADNYGLVTQGGSALTLTVT